MFFRVNLCDVTFLFTTEQTVAAACTVLLLFETALLIVQRVRRGSRLSWPTGMIVSGASALGVGTLTVWLFAQYQQMENVILPVAACSVAHVDPQSNATGLNAVAGGFALLLGTLAAIVAITTLASVFALLSFFTRKNSTREEALQ